MNSRICITGLGAYTPLGSTVEELTTNLFAGVSGITTIEGREDIGLPSLAAGLCGDVKNHPSLAKKGLHRYDRISQLSVVAALEAVAHAGLEGDDLKNAAIVWGCGQGGMDSVDDAYMDLWVKQSKKCRPLTIVNIILNAPVFHIAQQTGIQGPSLTVSNACASSNIAMIEAIRTLRLGDAEIALVGGVESSLCPTARRAWSAAQAVCLPDAEDVGKSCKPFSSRRSGFAMAEGSACLVLETEASAKRRGATILGYILGYGQNLDVTNVVAPDPVRQGDVMRQAIKRSGIEASDVDYINAHGTGTKIGDISETQAIVDVFGTTTPVSSTKSQHGHLLGAAGAIEAIVTLQALRRGELPGNIFSKDVDPALAPANVITENTKLPSTAKRIALSNSFAFAGVNAAIIIQAA